MKEHLCGNRASKNLGKLENLLGKRVLLCVLGKKWDKAWERSWDTLYVRYKKKLYTPEREIEKGN